MSNGVYSQRPTGDNRVLLRRKSGHEISRGVVAICGRRPGAYNADRLREQLRQLLRTSYPKRMRWTRTLHLFSLGHTKARLNGFSRPIRRIGGEQGISMLVCSLEILLRLRMRVTPLR